jgi:UDP-GlcNAc:undecaprenyl-phosphate/decaprenyl-phosphate GlcNAc-1-phosphate transferase
MIGPDAILAYLIFFSALAIIAAATTWAMAHWRVLIDMPNERSSHIQPTPRGGGIGIVVAWLCAFIVLFLVSGQSGPDTPLLGLAIGAWLAAAGGLADDIRPQPFAAKLAVQIAASLIAMASGLVLRIIAIPGIGPVELGPLAWPLTLLWLVGLTNAYNFMDGLDGLAGATGLVVAFFLTIAAIALGDASVAIIALSLVAGCAGFLLWNRPPARIFMGDVGSQFLGFLFAGLALALAVDDTTGTLILIVPLLLLHFLFDTIVTAFRRWRKGERVTVAHRSHLYQRLNQSGWSHACVTLLLAAMAVLQGIGAVWVIALAPEIRWTMLLPLLAVQIAYAIWVARRS